jgi:uncharacterized membrane protein
MKKETLLYGAIAVVILLVFLELYIQVRWFLTPSMDAGMGHMGMMGGGGMRAMGGLGFHGFGLSFWVLVVLFLLLLYTSHRGGRGEEDPIEILNRRFALGEITREEYLERKVILEER